jgi:hypothetical protein
MMASLFLIYLVALGFVVKGKSKIAIYIVLINILLCLAMFNHHITLKLNLNF